jgi:hypothetical protein
MPQLRGNEPILGLNMQVLAVVFAQRFHTTNLHVEVVCANPVGSKGWDYLVCPYLLYPISLVVIRSCLSFSMTSFVSLNFSNVSTNPHSSSILIKHQRWLHMHRL